MSKTDITLRLADIRTAAAAMSLRLDDPAAEQRRLSLVAELLRAQGSLKEAFAAHLRHSLSECRGTHSRWDIQDDTEQLWTALTHFESLVRKTASELGAAIREASHAAQPPEGAHTDRREIRKATP